MILYVLHGGKKTQESLNSSTTNPDVGVTNDTPNNELFHLIDYYITHRQEIYTQAQLRHFYEQLNEKEKHPVLRSIDIKKANRKIQAKADI